MRQPTMNRLSNINNPYQTEAKRVLCVCSAGLLRSPTAAVVLQREFGFNTRSCGIDEEYALIDCDEVLLNWADQIVVMEAWMIGEISPHFREQVIVLDVPDKFPYMDKELQRLIIERYNERNTS
jgi:predicted protein tyrosine phosphatase